MTMFIQVAQYEKVENKMNKKNILILTPMKFYSSEDEELLFDWLDKIGCIESYKGVGKELHVVISSPSITFNEYRNFNGLFKRYRFKDPGQLKALFETEENKDWFD